MQGDTIFASILGIIMVVGLVVLIVIESTRPETIRTVRQTDVLPVPYQQRYRPNYYPNYRPTTPIYPITPSYRPTTPTQLVGDRSTPFCEHTSHGCYPGTQTPIP
jgi:hypothetical protein